MLIRHVAREVDFGGQSTPLFAFVQATSKIHANPMSFRRGGRCVGDRVDLHWQFTNASQTVHRTGEGNWFRWWTKAASVLQSLYKTRWAARFLNFHNCWSPTSRSWKRSMNFAKLILKHHFCANQLTTLILYLALSYWNFCLDMPMMYLNIYRKRTLIW